MLKLIGKIVFWFICLLVSLVGFSATIISLELTMNYWIFVPMVLCLFSSIASIIKLYDVIRGRL